MMRRPRPRAAVERLRDVLDGRAGFRINASWGHVSVLAGGGHICELGLNSVPGVNPLWRPEWTTIDPQAYDRRHEANYGPAPDGRLLAGIAGHSLSFDQFGPPSQEEIAAGLSTHGEAPGLKWSLSNMDQSRRVLQYGARFPQAQIRFNRKISADRVRPVVYCEEQAENLSPYDRPICWNEHVTFGPPFLECGTTVFDMPAIRAKVSPATYNSQMFLQPDAEFTWPKAPTKQRGIADLRTTPNRRFGQYTAQLLDPKLQIAFISACNPKQGLLVVYVFRRADFPWVGNWEERNSRSRPPWKGRTFCRGIEFSTTPFAIPRRETIDQGPLFGERTFRWLPAKSKLRIRFLILLFQVPRGFSGVRQVAISRGVARVRESGGRGRELKMAVRDFL
jgi:hypothetical protein